MQQFAVLAPKGVNLNSLIRFATSIDSTLKLDVNYLKYLINYILSGMARRFEISDHDIYIPIYSQAVRIRFSRHIKHIRFLCETWLGNINILFRKDYQVGQSFSYAISPFYQNEPVEVHYIENTRIANLARQDQTLISPVLTAKNCSFHYLLKYFSNKHLKINLPLAVKLCSERFQTHQNYQKHLSEMSTILEIFNGTYRIYYSKESDGRVHTSLTRLPKVYRQFICYDNKKLLEIDLSNAVIYFLAALSKGLISDNIISSSLVYMFAEMPEPLDIAEIDLLWDLACKGRFYDFFIPEFLKVFNEMDLRKAYILHNSDDYVGSPQQIRKVVKKRIFSMLFAKPSQFVAEQKIFAKYFPSLLDKIQNYKTIYPYNQFSHMLFQIEANVVLGKVAKKFNSIYWRKAPIFSLHDCLITTCDYGIILFEVMNNEFTEIFGMPPQLELNGW